MALAATCHLTIAYGVVDTGGNFTNHCHLPRGSTTPVANFATSSACVVDTGGKFPTGVNDTGGKFSSGVNDVGGKLPPVSTTPAANLENNGSTIRLQKS
jgi:hypothetical protein